MTPTPTSSASTTSTPAPARPGSWTVAGKLNRLDLNVRLAQIGGNVLAVDDGNECRLGITATEDSGRAEIWQAGIWTETASLPRPRTGAVLVALPDSSVLVAGGTTDDPAQSFSSSFRFSEATEVWERSGDLISARSAPAGAVLADGRVLIAGGFFTDQTVARRMTVLDSAEIYDPPSGRWTHTAPLLTARQGATAVALADGRVVIVGGYSDATESGGSDDVRTMEIFDSAAERWSGPYEIPVHLPRALVALADGSVLAVGPDAVFRLPTDGSTWQPAAAMTKPAFGRSIIALSDGRGLAVGGVISDGDPEVPYITDSEIYDPRRDRWEATSPMPLPRLGGSAIRLQDGSILIAGGAKGPGELGAPSCPDPAPRSAVFFPPQ